MTNNQAVVEVFWKANETRTAEQRREFASRILKDQDMLEDLYDHYFIESAKKVEGKGMDLEEYENEFAL